MGLRRERASAEALEMFADVAHALSRINHPGVLRVEDVHDGEGRLFAATPPLRGATLARLITVARSKRRAAPFRVAARLVLEVAAGLEAITALEPERYAFGGLSPHAVWVSVDRRALVLPSARCPALERGDHDALRYRAPELARGEGDSRADVFALALLLWDLATVASFSDFGHSHATTRATKGTLPDEVQRFVLTSLSDDPDERVGDATEFRVALTGLLAGPEAKSETPTRVKHATSANASPSGWTPVTYGWLRVLSGVSTAPELCVTSAKTCWVIGRAAHADLVVRDPDVSRRHFSLSHEGGLLWVRDLDSKNGIFVNGAPSRGHALQPNDEVRAGTTTFRFEH